MSTPAFKRPVSVLVVVHCAGRILLLERRSPRGFWQSVTGSLEDNESPEAAAIRELDEETGLSADGLTDLGLVQRFPILPEWSRRFEPGVRENVEHAFALELADPMEPLLRREEHLAFRWLPARDALALASSWTNRNAIRTIYDIDGLESG
jgi:dATP pyrophosphohydrolase